MKYVNREQLNNTLGMILSGPISMDEITYSEQDKLLSAAESLRQKMTKKGFSYTEDQAIIASMIMGVMKGSEFDINLITTPVLDSIFKNGHVFHEGELESNPYYRDIYFDKQKSGKFELSIGTFRKYELFMYNTPKSEFQGVMIPAIGTIDHRFKFPSIKENDSAWMSITPNEIYTMKKPIEDASGKVLTLGCGMGYFAYMTALKDDVESVTIVEKEQDVIDLFTTFILPQFSCKDKIKIIYADAFDFMENLPDGEYDYCFVDIWKGNLDTVPYLKMKKLCNRLHKTIMSYWIEDALMATIMGYVYIIILEEFYKNQHMAVPPLFRLPEDEAYNLSFLRDSLKDAEVSKPEHVDYFMDYHNIIKLIS